MHEHTHNKILRLCNSHACGNPARSQKRGRSRGDTQGTATSPVEAEDCGSGSLKSTKLVAQSPGEPCSADVPVLVSLWAKPSRLRGGSVLVQLVLLERKGGESRALETAFLPPVFLTGSQER